MSTMASACWLPVGDALWPGCRCRHTATCRPQQQPDLQRHQAGLLLTQPAMPLGQHSAALQHSAQAGAGGRPAGGMPGPGLVSPVSPSDQPQAQQLAWQGLQPVAADGVATYKMSDAGAGWDQPADQLLGASSQPTASAAARQLPVTDLGEAAAAGWEAQAAVEEPGPGSRRVDQASGAAMACFQQLKAAALPAVQQRQGWPAAVKRQAEGGALCGESLSPPPKRSRKAQTARHSRQGVLQVGCNSGCRMHAVAMQPCDPDSTQSACNSNSHQYGLMLQPSSLVMPTDLHTFAGTLPKEHKAFGYHMQEPASEAQPGYQPGSAEEKRFMQNHGLDSSQQLRLAEFAAEAQEVRAVESADLPPQGGPLQLATPALAASPVDAGQLNHGAMKACPSQRPGSISGTTRLPQQEAEQPADMEAMLRADGAASCRQDEGFRGRTGELANSPGTAAQGRRIAAGRGTLRRVPARSKSRAAARGRPAGDGVRSRELQADQPLSDLTAPPAAERRPSRLKVSLCEYGEELASLSLHWDPSRTFQSLHGGGMGQLCLALLPVAP